MNTILSAVVILATDINLPRRRGWRCACEFDGIAGADGVRLLGVEVTPAAGEQILPGEETEVTLRLWARLSEVPKVNTKVLFYEGERLVASGIVRGTVEIEKA